MSLFPNGALCPCLIPRMETNSVRTPVSSNTSRRAASGTSSPCSTKPVGSFQKSGRDAAAAGPRRSWTSNTFPSPFITNAPMPTWWLAFGGRWFSSESPGSHLVIMTCVFSAWWYSKPPTFAAAPTSCACSMGIWSHTPRTPAASQAANEAVNDATKASTSSGKPAGSTITPPYRSAACASVAEEALVWAIVVSVELRASCTVASCAAFGMSDECARG